jgi:hypothetical protein
LILDGRLVLVLNREVEKSAQVLALGDRKYAMLDLGIVLLGKLALFE